MQMKIISIVIDLKVEPTMKFKLLILFIMIFLFIGDIAQNSSITYRSLVDGYKGFYRVVDAETGGLTQYENNTLNINVGDKIVWINDDQSDVITIISEQELWRNNSAVLKYTGRQFEYTFNETGTYTFYVIQRPAFRQTVVVADSPTIDNTSSSDTNLTVDTTPYPDTITDDADAPTENDTSVTNITNESTTTENDTSITNITNESTITENDTNVTNITNKPTSTNPILAPLNILKNFKKIGLAIFAIVMIIFLIKK